MAYPNNLLKINKITIAYFAKYLKKIGLFDKKIKI